MTSRGSKDIIEIDDAASDEEILDCWTPKKGPTVRKPEGGVPLARRSSGGMKATNGRVSSSSQNGASHPAAKVVQSRVPVASKIGNRPSTSGKASGQSNLLPWVHSSKSTASSLLPSERRTADATGGPLSQALGVSTASNLQSSLQSKASSGGSTNRNGARVLVTAKANAKILQEKSQKQHDMKASETATVTGKRKSTDKARPAETTIDIASSSDNDSSDSGSSFCEIDEQPRPSTFGEQRCTVGTTLNDAISVNSSDDSDSDGSTSSPKANRSTTPYRPMDYEDLHSRRQERKRRIAINQARKAREKLKRKAAHLNPLDTNNTPACETRKSAETNQIQNQPNAVTVNIKPSPMRRLRVVPTFGRSARALHGAKASSIPGPTKSLEEKEAFSNKSAEGLDVATKLLTTHAESARDKDNSSKPASSLAMTEGSGTGTNPTSASAASSAAADIEIGTLVPEVVCEPSDENDEDADAMDTSSASHAKDVSVQPNSSGPLRPVDTIDTNTSNLFQATKEISFQPPKTIGPPPPIDDLGIACDPPDEKDEIADAMNTSNVSQAKDASIQPKSSGPLRPVDTMDTNTSNLCQTKEISSQPKTIGPPPPTDYAAVFRDDITYLKGMRAIPDTDVVVDDDDIDDNFELGAWAVCVKHLSRKSLDPISQLPLWEFTVHGGDDSILYMFKTFVAPSKIAEGGNGAFIEFMGARRLNATSSKRRQRLIGEMTYVHAKTRDPLQAYPEENGSGVVVKLTGQNLHGEGNRSYVPTNGLRKIRAKCKGKSVRVQVTGASIHDIPEFDAYHIGESSPLKPIGYLGTQISCEYSKDPSMMDFIMPDNCIDLGRYGPFRTEDRLPDDVFILKSFVFSNEPQEWCYTVDEPLHGMSQYIDITSHDTGEPSDLARLEIPMFVNEVGHNDKFKQNVWIRDSLDARVVRYYFKGELRKGEPVELLTNYRSSYEPVRERKGYGLRNIHEGLPSNSNVAERLRRGFDARDDAVDTIHGTESIERLRYLLDFIETSIWQPIVSRADDFLNQHHHGQDASRLTPKQWAAARRIIWVAGQFLQEVEQRKLSTTDKSLFSFYELKIKQCLSANEARIAKSILPLLSLGRDVLGVEAFDALEYESFEEICYGVRDKLLMVHNTSVYCPIARELIDQLCGHLVPLHSFGLANIKTKEDIVACFYKSALEKMQEVLDCIARQDYAKLQFSSGVMMKSRLTASSDEVMSMLRTSNAFFLQNSTVPKGIIAAFLDELHYHEVVELVETSAFGAPTRGSICDQLAMVRYDGVHDLDELSALASIPVDVSKLKGSSRINDDWYIQTQVVWIVHVFASHYLKGTTYTLSNLATHLHVDNRHSEFVSTRGLDLVRASCFDEFLSRKCDRPKSVEKRDPNSKRGPTSQQKTNLHELAEPNQTPHAPQSHPKAKNVRATKKQNGSGGSEVNRVDSASKDRVTPPHQPKNALKPPSTGRVTQSTLVYEGPPTISLPSGVSWPPNWIQRTYQRQNGASKVDSYWFPPPDGCPRLRSKVEVLRYIETTQRKPDGVPFVPR